MRARVSARRRRVSLARSRRDATVWPVTMRRARCQRDSRHRRGVDVPKRRVRGRTARGFFGDTRGFADKRILDAGSERVDAERRRAHEALRSSLGNFERPARLWETSSVRPRPPSSAPPRASLVVIFRVFGLFPCPVGGRALDPSPTLTSPARLSRSSGLSRHHREVLLSPDARLRHQQAHRRGCRHHPLQASSQQDRRVHHAPHEAHPARSRARHLPQAPGGGARAPHGLRARRVRPRGRDHRG